MEENSNQTQEYLDKRVHDELEALNTSAEDINKLEKELDELKSQFDSTLHESTQVLKQIQKRLSKHVERARPYYDALQFAYKAQIETQKAAQKFQRAVSIHKAAKETIALAEERLFSISDKREFDSAWQEMLNHATVKVNESEVEKLSSEAEHLDKSAQYTQAQKVVQELERKLKGSMSRSRLYFDHKDMYERRLHAQKRHIELLQRSITSAKRRYAAALKNLEEISNQVHEERKASSSDVLDVDTTLLPDSNEEGETSSWSSINLDELVCGSGEMMMETGSSCSTDVTTSSSGAAAPRPHPHLPPHHIRSASGTCTFYLSDTLTSGDSEECGVSSMSMSMSPADSHNNLSRKASDLSTTTTSTCSSTPAYTPPLHPQLNHDHTTGSGSECIEPPGISLGVCVHAGAAVVESVVLNDSNRGAPLSTCGNDLLMPAPLVQCQCPPNTDTDTNNDTGDAVTSGEQQVDLDSDTSTREQRTGSSSSQLEILLNPAHIAS